MKIILLFVFILTVLALILFRDKDFSKLSLRGIEKTSIENPFNVKSKEKPEHKEIIINEADLSKIVKFSNSLGNANFQINEKGVTLISTLKTALGEYDSKAVIFPSVLDNKISAKVKELSVAGAKAPDFLKSLIEKAVRSAIDKQVEKGYKLKSIVLSKGQMVLILNKK